MNSLTIFKYIEQIYPKSKIIESTNNIGFKLILFTPYGTVSKNFDLGFFDNKPLLALDFVNEHKNKTMLYLLENYFNQQ